MSATDGLMRGMEVVAPQAPLPLSWSSGFRSSPSFLVEWLSLLSLFLGRVAFAPLPMDSIAWAEPEPLSLSIPCPDLRR